MSLGYLCLAVSVIFLSLLFQAKIMEPLPVVESLRGRRAKKGVEREGESTVDS